MAGPFTNGKNSTVTFYQDNNKIVLPVKGWSVKENAQLIADGVCGEDRDRLAKEVNYYEIELTCYVSDLKGVIAMLADTANNDTTALPISKSVGIVVRTNDSGKVAFTASQVTADAWELSTGDRKDRIMFKLPLRARYLDQAPTL